MTRFWVDVYDANGNRIGDGPVTSLTGATVRRVLDGPGSITFDVPMTDQRARELLTNERRFKVYHEIDTTKRMIAHGIIRQVRATSSSGGWRLNVDAVDILDELKRYNTLFRRKYRAQTTEEVLSDLLDLVPGWTLVPDGLDTEEFTIKFDGVSVLKAFQYVTDQQGLHLRLGEGDREVEVGPFGTETVLTLLNPELLPAPITLNPRVALVERVTLVESTEALANVLIPIGGGEGRAMLTLKKSTRTSPYTIQSATGPNGKPYYYLANEESIALYGRIEKPGLFKDISPISNSAADQTRAANALYTAARVWLNRNCVSQQTYQVSCLKPKINVRPGDKVRLKYTGVVPTREGEHVFLDIDEDLWVISATEIINQTGDRISLEVSTIDQKLQDSAEVVLGAVEAIKMRELSVQPYPARSNFTRFDIIDATHPVTFNINITEATLDLVRCLLTIKTRPLRSNVSVADAGGEHRHKVFDNTSSVLQPEPTLYYPFQWSTNSGGSLTGGALPMGTTDVYTVEGSGTHTHPLTYGVFDDTTYPRTISLSINGVDVTSALGGPWGTTLDTAADVTLDITDYLLDAVGGLQQAHEIVLSCGTRKGTVETLVEIFDIIQAIDLDD